METTTTPNPAMKALLNALACAEAQAEREPDRPGIADNARRLRNRIRMLECELANR